MDVSLESALNDRAAGAEQTGRIVGRPLEDWNAAYAKVESYFHAFAFGIRCCWDAWSSMY